MFGGLRIGSIAGIGIFVDWSLLIVFFLVTFSLGAGTFPVWHPDWDPALIWGIALAAALCFFASILIHELSHALVGRAHGIDIKRITLFVFGGMAHLEREPHAWRAELMMAVVGPITSLLLGMLFIALGERVAGGIELDPAHPEQALASLNPAATLLLWLGPINILLGLFNLVPGFPLDGGRVLRAALWGATGDLRLATRWASRLGQAVAWLLIVTGFAMMLGIQVPLFGTGIMSGMWLALIGWFLNNAAMMSYQQLTARLSLQDLPVSRVMQSTFVTVDPDMRVSRLVDEYFLRSDQRAYPVVEDGRLVGLVCLHDVREIERDAWARTAIRDIMTPTSSLTQFVPGDDAASVLQALTRQQINQAPVVENGQLRGLVSLESVLKWLSLQGEHQALTERNPAPADRLGVGT